MYYCQRLRDLREDCDLSQNDICKYLNMKQPQYSRYERGERDIPLDVLVILAKYYNVSCDYILGLTNDKRGIGYTKQSVDKNKVKENNSSGKYNITQSNSGGLNNISIKDK